MNSREALGSVNSGGPRVNIHGVKSPTTQVGVFPARNVSNRLCGKWARIKKAKVSIFFEIEGCGEWCEWVMMSFAYSVAHILLLNTESSPDTQKKVSDG